MIRIRLICGEAARRDRGWLATIMDYIGLSDAPIPVDCPDNSLARYLFGLNYDEKERDEIANADTAIAELEERAEGNREFFRDVRPVTDEQRRLSQLKYRTMKFLQRYRMTRPEFEELISGIGGYRRGGQRGAGKKVKKSKRSSMKKRRSMRKKKTKTTRRRKSKKKCVGKKKKSCKCK